MPNLAYTRDIPDGPHNPSSDQDPMKTNTNSTDTIIAVEHFGFNNTNGGLHQQVTMPIRAGAPVTTIGQLALFSTNFVVNDFLQLCYTRDNTGLVFAITGLMDPIKGPVNALTSLIGNMYLQCGSVSPINPGGTVTVTYPKPFPNAIYSVVCTPRTTTAIGGGTHDWDVSAVGLSTFKIATNGNYAVGDTFYWIAIGS